MLRSIFVVLMISIAWYREVEVMKYAYGQIVVV